MAKYSFDFKLKMVTKYISGEGSYRCLCRKYAISDAKLLRQWVAAYNTFGEKGITPSKKREVYTFDFKVHMVELYLTTKMSYQELALKVGITNPSLLCRWINDYRIAGPNALKPRMKGRKPKMKKTDKKNIHKDLEVNTNDSYLKQLEEENLKLKIENAYLKELRRLRLEEIPLKKKRE